MLKLFLLLSFFPAPSFAKRVMMVPPGVPEPTLSPAALKFLGQRVGEELRKCPGLRDGARLSLELKDNTGKSFDLAPVAEQLEKALAPKVPGSSRPADVRAVLSLKEWKGGKNLATYTLKAKALPGNAVKGCEKLHRTVLKRAEEK